MFHANKAMVAFVVSVIALLAAGIGIMNIMLISVTARSGIREAIGARKHDIVRQFLLEAIVLSKLGGLPASFVTEEAERLAPFSVARLAPHVETDALHIAVVAVHGMDD
jgi:hypothetical protein